MGKVLATWLVKVVAREPDDSTTTGDAEINAPTNSAVEEAVQAAVSSLGEGNFTVNATAERTDI